MSTPQRGQGTSSRPGRDVAAACAWDASSAACVMRAQCSRPTGRLARRGRRCGAGGWSSARTLLVIEPPRARTVASQARSSASSSAVRCLLVAVSGHWRFMRANMRSRSHDANTSGARDHASASSQCLRIGQLAHFAGTEWLRRTTAACLPTRIAATISRTRPASAGVSSTRNVPVEYRT